ncbi:MAG: hypothetical protein SPM02_03285 [Bacteroidales bacterium]|nr:hypothetical protein [Bacteroidales bacterium]
MKKNILTHIGAVVVMLAIAAIYFMPIIQGKALPQGDLQKYEGMAKAQKDYHAATGEYSTWCPSMFGGMPGYQITNSPQHSVFTPLKNILSLQIFGRQNDMGVLFLYLLGFYIALVALGVSPWLALLGGLAFGLGSYNIIIIEAGHITKAWALALMAPVLAGEMLCLKGAGTWRTDRRRSTHMLVWGGILFMLALGLQIALNHIQITFYTAIGGLLMGIAYAVYALKDKYFVRFLLSTGILVVGVVLAVVCNTRHLLVNEEYMQYTMRGGSEITVTPQDLYGKDYPRNNNSNENGLDINYAFSWSYGIGETYTLLVPGARGGGSVEPVSKSSASYSNFRQEKMPLYWGDQPFTSGPVYFGAIVIFLCLFGMIVVRGPERWWILAAMVLAILLSWGRNLMGFNEWMFNHLPLYNKFRTPSMSLVLANVLAVLMAVLGLKEATALHAQGEVKRLMRGLYISAGATVGVILIGLLASGSLSFSGLSDSEMARQYGDQWPMIQDIFVKDRKALFVSDSWRSILFILLAAATLWLYLKRWADKPKAVLPVVAVLAVLTVIDLQGVNSRYLNSDNYVRNARMLEMQPAQYDRDIDAIALQTGDQDYRVLNLAVNTFNDSKPSAFHNQVGGYSAAKLRRYQDLIDFYIGYRINNNVLNMLNTRYIVMNNGQVQRNPDALGNCWFVKNIRPVETANDEITKLNEYNPAVDAIINVPEMGDKLAGLPETCIKGLAGLPVDSNATIEMEHKRPADLNTLTYHSHCATPMLAVFSEIYYAPDWKAYIDGEPADYLRADYILRAMVIPAGDHVIEFRNESPTMHRLDNITLICSIVTVLIIGGVLFFYYRKRKNTEKK